MTNIKSEANTAAPALNGQGKKLFIKTYGCQMNVYDSERMAEAMGSDGYSQVDSAEAADMVLINT